MDATNSAEATTRSGRIRAAGAERRERQKAELRERILKAASELFLERGYEEFSLREVAEKVGYSPTTIYLYFRNKDDLLLAAVQSGFDAFDARLHDAAASTPDPMARLEVLGRAYIDWGLENPALYRLMFMQRSDFYFSSRLNPDALLAPDEAHLEMPRTSAMELLSSAVQEAMDAGLMRRDDPYLSVDVLWAGAHGLVSLAISPLMSPEHARQLVDRLLSTLLQGVRASS